MLLRDKVVVVSGVGPGLGQALARIAAAEGAKLVLGARNLAYLEQVKDEIIAAGGRAIVAVCDVRDGAQCKALADAAVDAYGGRIHGLVNSAYLHGSWSGVADADEEELAQVYDVNCLGALRLTKACLPFLKNGGAGVNVSTIPTMRPFGTEHGMELSYAAAKGGLNTLGKYMAADLGKHGIRVNTCRMGWIFGAPVQAYIDSQVAQGSAEADVVAGITKDIPLGVIPPQEDCARAVLMMISDYSAMVTGASLDVNGGQWVAP